MKLKTKHLKTPKAAVAKRPAARRGRPRKVREEGAQPFTKSDAEPAGVRVTRDVEAESVTPPANHPEAGQGSMLHLYLREIGQVKLLTVQEEIQLAKRIKKGDEAAREQM